MILVEFEEVLRVLVGEDILMLLEVEGHFDMIGGAVFEKHHAENMVVLVKHWFLDLSFLTIDKNIITDDPNRSILMSEINVMFKSANRRIDKAMKSKSSWNFWAFTQRHFNY
jgi:hypothetical protein